jgi:hypothetical protein
VLRDGLLGCCWVLAALGRREAGFAPGQMRNAYVTVGSSKLQQCDRKGEVQGVHMFRMRLGRVGDSIEG